MANKLSGWKRHTLSMAGLLVLVKSVIHALPSFLVQIYMIPKTQIAKMDQICRSFLWGNSDAAQRKFHSVAWNLLCSPPCAGCLGIWNLAGVNRALITKLAWNICTVAEKPWVQLIKAKYLRGRKLLDVQRTEWAISWVGKYHPMHYDSKERCQFSSG